MYNNIIYIMLDLDKFSIDMISVSMVAYIKGSKGNRACATVLGKLPKLIVSPQFYIFSSKFFTTQQVFL